MRKNTRRTRRSTSRNMSVSELRKLVMEEASKLSGELEDIESVEAEEVDADGYADSLESDIDMYKKMGLEERRLHREYKKIVREARKVRRNKNLAKKKILRRLK